MAGTTTGWGNSRLGSLTKIGKSEPCERTTGLGVSESSALVSIGYNAAIETTIMRVLSCTSQFVTCAPCSPA